MISLAVIISFVFFSIITFKDALTPYVNFATAKTLPKTVQVRGTIAKDTIAIDPNTKMLTFKLLDESGEDALVTYGGTKPEGLETATSIVAIGRYQQNHFMTEKLLVKCPSKYQGSVTP